MIRERLPKQIPFGVDHGAYAGRQKNENRRIGFFPQRGRDTARKYHGIAGNGDGRAQCIN